MAPPSERFPRPLDGSMLARLAPMSGLASAGDAVPAKPDGRPRADSDRELCRRRNVPERRIGWMKECRRLATRFGKLAVSLSAMLRPAMIRLCPRRSSHRARWSAEGRWKQGESAATRPATAC